MLQIFAGASGSPAQTVFPHAPVVPPCGAIVALWHAIAQPLDTCGLASGNIMRVIRHSGLCWLSAQVIDADGRHAHARTTLCCFSSATLLHIAARHHTPPHLTYSLCTSPQASNGVLLRSIARQSNSDGKALAVRGQHSSTLLLTTVTLGARNAMSRNLATLITALGTESTTALRQALCTSAHRPYRQPVRFCAGSTDIMTTQGELRAAVIRALRNRQAAIATRFAGEGR